MSDSETSMRKKRRRLDDDDDDDDDFKDDNDNDDDVEDNDLTQNENNKNYNNNNNNNNDETLDETNKDDVGIGKKNNDEKIREARRRRRLQRELRELQDSNNNFRNTSSNNDNNNKNNNGGGDGNDLMFPGDDGYEEVVRTEVVADPIVENDDDYEQEDNNDVVYDYEEYMGEKKDGEDLMENAFDDYQRIDALDEYGQEGLDDAEYDQMDEETRRLAEQEMARRDKENMGSRREGALQRALEDWMEQTEVDEDRERRRKRFGRAATETRDDMDNDSAAAAVVAEEDVDEEDEEEVNLEAFDVPLQEWIAQDRTRRAIQKKFRAFLRSYDAGSNRRSLYETKIRSMCASNLSSLEISYMHLMTGCTVVAIWMVDAPRDMLRVLQEAATKHTLSLFPSYASIAPIVHVRLLDLPLVDSLRDLRQSHLDSFVRVHGVVTRRTAIYPQIHTAYYDCMACKALLGPFTVPSYDASLGSSSKTTAAQAHTPSQCQVCQTEVGPFRLNNQKTLFRNVQRLHLQETPGSVPPGRVPRTKEVVLTDDLIDAARPGEEVHISGIYSHTYDSIQTSKSGFPVFSTYIEANHVLRKEDDQSVQNMTPDDIQLVQKLAQQPNIAQRIVASIAPSIHGQQHVKMALAMSLFGGVPKNVSDKHSIRGDINILLLGDPGTAKSQFLKYAQTAAPRAVYSTGKGASAVGLTAAVQKDPITREWTLEGGALVLADRGLCLIDEFDKMNEQDRTSIHEAMEQQSISVSKAGIVTSLQARCAVIAAANPIGGRYDSTSTLADNVLLTDPILQRFDILCVLQDTVDPVADEQLAAFVTQSHMDSLPTANLVRGDVAYPSASEEQNGQQPPQYKDGVEVLPQSLLKKYIQYARIHVQPVLRGNAIDQEKIASLYVALRKESTTSGGVPIAVRHIESLMRMAEAHAKMHLRDSVREDDVDAAIQVLLTSFVQAQKFSVQRQLKRSFAKYMTSATDTQHLLLHILQDLMRNEAMYQTIRQKQQPSNDLPPQLLLEVPKEELQARARDRRIYQIDDFCKSQEFKQAGYTLDTTRQVICRIHHTNTALSQSI